MDHMEDQNMTTQPEVEDLDLEKWTDKLRDTTETIEGLRDTAFFTHMIESNRFIEVQDALGAAIVSMKEAEEAVAKAGRGH